MKKKNRPGNEVKKTDVEKKRFRNNRVQGNHQKQNFLMGCKELLMRKPKSQ